MKTILIFVSTLDGKVTKWGADNVKLWSSQQDQDHYKKVWSDSQLIVIGSNSFKTETFKPSVNQQLIVMTSDPGKYKTLHVSDQVQFTNESPSALVSRLKDKGHDQLLVVGGPHVATSFLKEGLIDELWLTLEPKIFGTGANFATGINLDINLQLVHFEKVNEPGTLITKYKVLRNNL